MNDQILEAIIGLLLLGILVLGCHDYYEAWQLTKTRMLVESYQTQISNLESDAIAARHRVKDAESRAVQQMQKVKESTAIIIAENVPHDCIDAMKWAVKQAKSL